MQFGKFMEVMFFLILCQIISLQRKAKIRVIKDRLLIIKLCDAVIFYFVF